MLRDELIKYYYPGNGYNYSCAEAMMHAVDDYYDLNLPKESFLAASSFSGGCWHNEMCGGLSSSLAVLGILYSRDGHGHDSPELKKMAFELFSRFEEKFGNGKCWRLKKAYYVPERKCEVLLVHIADILEDIIAKNEIINK